MIRSLILALTATASLAVAQIERPREVLFIGNSLTMANGLPAMVESLARLAGGVPIRATTIAGGGYSLEDHWDKDEARRTIARGGWSAVVLQQGPSSQPASQAQLRASVRRFDAEARKVNARVAIYMVWPPRTGPGTFDQVHASYAQAARDVDGILLPVGDAFRALVDDPSFALLEADGFHPTPLGTFVAAAVILQGLSGGEPFVPTSLAPSGDAFPAVRITPQMAERLRSVIRTGAPTAR